MLRRIDDGLAWISGALSGVFLVAIAGILLLQVIGRNVLQHPFPWPEEVAGFLFVWLIFFGATHAYTRGGLIGIDWLLEKLPPLPRSSVKLASDLMVIAVLGGLIWVGVQATIAAGGSRTTVLRFSWSWVYLAFPIGSSLLFLAFLAGLLRDIGALAGTFRSTRASDGDQSR